MNTTSTKPRCDDVTVANYICCFIDILGQKDVYEGQGLMPQFSCVGDRDAFTANVRRSLGPIFAIHTAARENLEALGRQHTAGLSGELEEAAAKIRAHRIKCQRWSDGFVYFASLHNGDREVVMNAAAIMMALAGNFCLTALSNRFALRGGIDISWGAEVYDEINGPVVAHAYELESVVAKYPRVVVSDRAVQFIRAYADADTPLPVVGAVNKSFAMNALELLAIDDGVAIVDYLGKGLSDAFASEAYCRKRANALRFAQDELAKFSNQGDVKLTGRYERLLQYFKRSEISGDKSCLKS